ncbi:MAG TPA: PadR family transcriptional regulator [Mycobacteriales bacterium]|jgi:Predicted transcriptional regulators
MTPVFGHGRLRLYLLRLLDESPRHGYQLIRLLEDRFEGRYVPSAGTIYPRLRRLEAEGLVTHSQSSGRKVYRLTDAGRAELRDRAGEMADLETQIGAAVRELAHEVGEQVRDTARDLHAEVRATRDLRAAERDQPAWQSFLAYLEQRGQPDAGSDRRPGLAEPPGATRRVEPSPAVAVANSADERDFEHHLQRVRDQVRDLVHEAMRDGQVSPEQLQECSQIISNTLIQVRAVLQRRR